jgi:hypothetical protein
VTFSPFEKNMEQLADITWNDRLTGHVSIELACLLAAFMSVHGVH